eukprot:TRINITY_DN14814_c0_g1_i1.p1 TRINITY_DN14814_c0_g1~~TRINITY_DN14814_c0_g1_i1.p1  ORF type:complete len:308 (+),score=78.43 TRINITY_DN14814_c0_g1_i1:90-1013(+)
MERSQALIKYGANVNATDQWKMRPLHAAVRQKNLAVVKELIQCHPMADPLGTGGNHHTTPVHLAAEQGFLDILKLLVEASGNLKQAFQATTTNGETPLHLAAKKGRLPCVGYIAPKMKKLDMDVDIEDNNKSTPLILAGFGGHTEVAEKLMEVGADPHKENILGDSYNSIREQVLAANGDLKLQKLAAQGRKSPRAGKGKKVTVKPKETPLDPSYITASPPATSPKKKKPKKPKKRPQDGSLHCIGSQPLVITTPRVRKARYTGVGVTDRTIHPVVSGSHERNRIGAGGKGLDQKKFFLGQVSFLIE